MLEVQIISFEEYRNITAERLIRQKHTNHLF